MTPLPSFLNKLAVLKQIPIFAGLNWFELNRISRRAVFVEVDKGDILCKQGDPADAFYALVSGRIHSYALNEAGQKEGSDFIMRGTHFGVISALTGILVRKGALTLDKPAPVAAWQGAGHVVQLKFQSIGTV